MIEQEESDDERVARQDNPPLADRVFNAATDDVYSRSEDREWDPLSLPFPLRIIALVDSTLGTVNNGSLTYFFENDWPNQPPYSVFIEAFRTIGALETANCLEDAVSAFGFENPQLDCDARRAVLYPDEGESTHVADLMEALSCRIIAFERDIMVLASEFISRHIESFPSVQAQIDGINPADGK